MATLKLTIFKAKVLKNGKHKIRIALCHKGETCYILTRYLIDSENQFKNGLIQKRPDASMMNMHLRSLLNAYQEKLNEVQNQSMYTCRQLKDIISRNVRTSESSTFKSVSTEYIKELTRWQKIRLNVGGWAIGIVIITVLIVVGKLVYKLKKKEGGVL